MDINEFSENYQKSLQNHSNTVNTSGNDHDIALEDDDNCIQNDKTPIQYSDIFEKKLLPEQEMQSANDTARIKRALGCPVHYLHYQHHC